MNRPTPVKLALLETSWLRMGSTHSCLASSKAADSTLPRGTWRHPGLRLLPASPPNQVRRRDRSLAQAGGAIEFCHQPARKRGDDTGVTSE